ncbi:MAG: PQQ-binding-like beta-propeller repeat protein, partial [Polyangiales bacterium]
PDARTDRAAEEGDGAARAQGRAVKLRALGVAALAILAGCSGIHGGTNPKAPLWEARPGWVIDVVFRRELTALSQVSAKAGVERGVPAIDPRHARVFVGSSDHGLYALRATDGSVLWRYQTAGSVMSEPLYDESRDLVYFGSDDDGLYAVHASNGELVFRYRTGAEVQRRPVIVARDKRSILVFDNAADSIFAIDADTGAPVWKHQRNPALGLEVAGHAGVAYGNDRIYVAFSTGAVTAYDIDTGVERWPEINLAAPTTAGDDVQKFLDVDTTPIVRGDRVFVANVGTGVYALDAQSGTSIWKRPEATAVSWLAQWNEPAHTDHDSGAQVPEMSLLLAGSGTTGLWALDPKSGEIRWRKSTPRGSLSYPVAIQGALLVTSSKLGLFLLEPRSGAVIDGLDPDSGFSGGAAAFGGKAYVLTNGGMLLGLEVAPPAEKMRSTRASY